MPWCAWFFEPQSLGGRNDSFVTGATGTIGSATVQALKDKGAKFKVGARSPDKLKGQGVEAVLFDWDKPETYGPALKGVEKVFLLPPTSDKQVEYTQKLVDEAKKAGVKHIVKLSVIGADAKPGIILGRQHLEGEKVIQASGLAWTMLRPTFFMDNFVNYYGADPKKDSTMYASYGDKQGLLGGLPGRGRGGRGGPHRQEAREQGV